MYPDFHEQPSLGLTEDAQKKRKYPVRDFSFGENPLLMQAVRGEWSEWFKLIEQPRSAEDNL